MIGKINIPNLMQEARAPLGQLIGEFTFSLLTIALRSFSVNNLNCDPDDVCCNFDYTILDQLHKASFKWHFKMTTVSCRELLVKFIKTWSR